MQTKKSTYAKVFRISSYLLMFISIALVFTSCQPSTPSKTEPTTDSSNAKGGLPGKGKKYISETIDVQGFSISFTELKKAYDAGSKITIIYKTDLTQDPIFINPIPCYSLKDQMTPLITTPQKRGSLLLPVIDGNEVIEFSDLKDLMAIPGLTGCEFTGFLDKGNLALHYVPISPSGGSSRSTNPSPPGIF